MTSLHNFSSSSGSDLLHEALLQCSHLVKKRKVIKLIWVPAHVGIRANEMAGTGAKQALKQGTVEMALSKMEAKSIESTSDENEAAAQVRQQVKVKTLM